MLSRVLLTCAAKYLLVVKKLHVWHWQTRVICSSTTTVLDHFLYKKITSTSHRLLPGWLMMSLFYFTVQNLELCTVSTSKLVNFSDSFTLFVVSSKQVTCRSDSVEWFLCVAFELVKTNQMKEAASVNTEGSCCLFSLRHITEI